MKELLKSFGGPGLFDTPLSTSNLYQPQRENISSYLEKDERELLDLLSNRLCKYHNSKFCILFSTGFWALVAAIKLKALAGKSQVIIPSLTYRRLADVVYWAGLTPVFVDIDPNTVSVCPKSIETAINGDTALILAVHPIVNCCEIDSILNISGSHSIPVVFDAVESVHETYKGQRIGSFGIGEVFSMHASKFINGLEGGYICTNEQDFAEALDGFKQGLSIQYKGKNYIGINGIPSAGHAAFALAGLDEVQENVDHNKDIYDQYTKYLANQQGLKLLKFDEAEQTSYKNIVAEVTDAFPINRDRLVETLNTESVFARKHYSPPLHKKEFQYPTISTHLKNTEHLEHKLINLPCGSRVSKQDIEHICKLIKLIAETKSLPDG